MAQVSSTKTVLALGKLIVDRVFPAAPTNDNTEHDLTVIDGTYSYISDDFKHQGYVVKKGILFGVWMIPLYDNESPRKQVGYISWMISAIPEDLNNYGNEKISCHDHLTISIGTDDKAHTCHGSALNTQTGGYYDEGKEFKFSLSGGPGEDAIVTITNVGNDKREVVVKRVGH